MNTTGSFAGDLIVALGLGLAWLVPMMLIEAGWIGYGAWRARRRRCRDDFLAVIGGRR